MEKVELAFIPAPGAGHLAPMVELAKILTSRAECISATVFIMDHTITNSYTQTLLSNPPPPHVRFIHLSLDEPTADHLRSLSVGPSILELARINKSRVNEFLSSELNHRLGGIVVDFFCTQFIDVATKLRVPSYVFFTCGVGTLSLLIHLQYLKDVEKLDIMELKDSGTELQVPGFQNPVPAKVFPYAIFEKGSDSMGFMEITSKLRKAKGILVNSFAELEPCATQHLLNDQKIPPIYTVGPIVNLNPENNGNKVDEYKNIMMWLDAQPQTSVLFLCFGSMGTFPAEQVLEIARALENSGHRFLWALRRPPPKGMKGPPTEYENLNNVLPEGFLDRTKDIGRVIGWAPQIAVLAHPAVGGFVSHCGWNSTLESLWYGVPIATWPLYAEQQLNAFELVKESEIAVEIKLDYRKDNPEIVSAGDIEKGIRQLMEGSKSTEIRKKVMEISQNGHMALVNDGSSNVSVGRFVQEVLGSG